MVAPGLILLLLLPALKAQTCPNLLMIEKPANVILGGLFDIHRMGPGGTGGTDCGSEVNPGAVQRLEAFLYAIDEVNSRGIIPGVNLGAMVYDTCETSSIALKRTMNYLARREGNQRDQCDFWPAHLGVVGPFSSDATTEVASLLTSAKVTQIGYSARADALSDKKTFPYFVRVVPEGKTIVKVTIDLMKMLGWYDVAVVTGSDSHSEELLQGLSDEVGGEDICIMDVIRLNNSEFLYSEVIAQLEAVHFKGVRGVILLTTPDVTEKFFKTLEHYYTTAPGSRELQWLLTSPFRDNWKYQTTKASRYVRGLISVQEYSGDAANFRNHFVSLDAPRLNTENPWFNVYWEQVNNCTLYKTCDSNAKGEHASSYEQAVYVGQVIASVYTYAHALKAAHADLCMQSGTCAALGAISAEKLTQYLKMTEFINVDQEVIKFDGKGNFADAKYSIMNVQINGNDYEVKEVGTWTEAKGLDMESDTPFKMYAGSGDQLPNYPPSQCNKLCRCENPMYDNSFGAEAPGDILLAGLFDIHSSGALGRECDFTQIDDNGMQALEAFYYAIDQINLDATLLPELRLSGAVFDTCRNAQRTVRQIREVISGRMHVPGSDGDKPVTVGTVVGAASSDVSMAVAEFLAAHKIPQISFGSSNSELSDRKRYPYFLRTVGSDIDQSRALVDILEKFDWQYVTVIFSNNAYGSAAFKQFMAVAEERSICVATQVALESYFVNDDEAMNNVAKYYLLESANNASVVVLLTTDTDARAVLAAVKRQLGAEPNRLVWVASDYWGSRSQVVKDLEDVAEGAITVGFYATEIGPFMEYFKNLTPGSTDRDPWFDEYWQRRFDCHINTAFKNSYPNRCQARLTLQNQNIKMAAEVPYVIDAVYAAAVAIHNMIIDLCGEITVPICNEARLNMDKLTAYLAVTDFYNGLTKLNVTFDVLGNGIPRYNVFNFKRDRNSKLDYINVGNWLNDKLDIKDQQAMAYPDSDGVPIPTLSVPSQCPACPCTSTQITDLQFQVDYQELALLGYFPIHSSTPGAPCSAYRPDVGFLEFMAFKYAIDAVNNDPDLLPGLTLGYMALDTCSDPAHSAHAFRASQDQLRLFSQLHQTPRLTTAQAFIGGFEDQVTMRLNELNDEGHQWVHISPGAKRMRSEEYPYFLRSAPADDAEAQALASAVTSLGWSYISIVVSDSTSAMRMMGTLRAVLEDNGICIAATVNISVQPESAKENLMVIDQLLGVEGAIGVVLLSEPKGVINLLEAAATRNDVKGRLIWLGTSLWADSWDLLARHIDLLRGAILVAPDTGRSAGFDDYMRRQNLLSDENNPWFREFWQSHFRCNLDYKAGYGAACTGKENLSTTTFSARQPVIATINAVFSYAKGLTNMFDDLCGNYNLPPCSSMKGEESAALTHQYVKEAKLEEGADGKPFSYTTEGSGPGRFKIFNIQIPGKANMHKSGMFEIGQWVSGDMTLNQSMVSMYDKKGDKVLPRSMCPGTCNCSMRQAYLDKENVPVRFTAHRYVWGIIVLTFAVMGIVFAFITMFFFVFKFKHPVVLQATCSLSVMLLFGIILLYLINFAFMTSATKVTCGMRRLCLGSFYALIYSCLLVKVIRVARLTNTATLGCKIPFIGGPSQTCLAVILTSIQVLIAVEWLILDPPDVQWYLTNIKDEGEYPIYVIDWKCKYTDNALVISLVYVFLLVLITLVLALRSVASSEVQHEAAYIGLTTFLTILALVAWICVYVIASPLYQTPAVCVGITVTASVVLLFMFAPKMAMLTASNSSSEDDDEEEAPTNNGIDVVDVPYAIPNRRGKDRPDSGFFSSSSTA